MNDLAEHQSKVEFISKQIKAWRNSNDFKTKKLRFYHGGTNSTKPKPNNDYTYINTSELNKVITIDQNTGIALVEPNVSMDALVKETLKYNLIPQVVTEFPGITVGGAIQGAALESSSFKAGQFNHSALEYEIITGTGDIIKASSTQNSDLFFGITSSYGTLGVLTSVKIQLTKACKYVEVEYLKVNSFAEAVKALKDYIDADYLDGIMYSSTEGVIVIGKKVNEGAKHIQTFTNASDPWFHKHAKEKVGQSELVPIWDYLFRYNRGAFWMGEFFFNNIKWLGGNNKLTRFIFNPFLKTRKLYEVLHVMNWTQNFIIQDIYYPANKTKEALEYFDEKLKIYPIWLCPIKNTPESEKLSPNYINTNYLIDIGIWGHAPKNANFTEVNKDIEIVSEKLNGRKMFYAQTFYSPEEFWNIYDKEWYETLRSKYGAEDAFPDIYEKVNVKVRTKQTVAKGMAKLFWSFITLKNLN